MAVKLAKTSKQYLDLLAGGQNGFVRSEENWRDLLKTRRNPLAKCPQQAVRTFTSKLEFKNGGLAHADYEMLMNHMTLKDFVKLWEHFGISREYLATIDHHKCVQKGDCEYYFPAICTSNC
jgi:hypothetical protein